MRGDDVHTKQITNHGRMVIPKEILDVFQLKEGDRWILRMMRDESLLNRTGRDMYVR